MHFCSIIALDNCFKFNFLAIVATDSKKNLEYFYSYFKIIMFPEKRVFLGKI